jgi:hypothetical protein
MVILILSAMRSIRGRRLVQLERWRGEGRKRRAMVTSMKAGMTIVTTAGGGGGSNAAAGGGAV